MFRGGPLTCPDDGQTRAVSTMMEAFARRDRSQTAPQMLTAPGECRIVGGGEVEAHHPEQGVQESFGLAQREMIEESQGQGGLDGEIRVPPHRHIAASNEGLVIGRPVRNAVLRIRFVRVVSRYCVKGGEGSGEGGQPGKERGSSL